MRRAAQLGIGEGTSGLYCDHSISALIHLLRCFLTWPKPGGNEFYECDMGWRKRVGFQDISDFWMGGK